MTSVTMPALGESVTEGTVTRWLKQEGDQVAVDEPLLEVSTDKVDTEIPSPVAGTLTKIVVAEDETVPVGAELAVIGEGDGQASDDSGAQEAGATAGVESPAEQPQEAQTPAAQEAEPGAQQADDQSEQQSTEPGAQQADDQSEQQSAVQGARQSDDQTQPAGSGGGGDGSAVTMPALGESVTEGTVTRWLKAEGDQVQADEPLLEVSTDKVDTEIPSPVSGILTKILVGEDETVAVGAELAMIGAAAAPGGEGATTQAPAQQEQAPAQQEQAPAQQEQAPAQQEQAPTQQEHAPAAGESKPEQPAGTRESTRTEPTQAAPASQDAPASQVATPTAAGSGSDPAYVTPLVRKLAAEHKVDLAALQGTGVGGRIRKQDVLAAAESAKAAAAAAPAASLTSAPAVSTGAAAKPAVPAATSPLRGTTEKMSRLRKVIATRMVESLQVSAQLTTVVEVDLTRVARLRARAKADFEAREGVKLSFLPFLAKATVEALKSYPVVNASIDTEKGEITYHGAEHLGIAVDTERGLLVPVVRDAGDLNIAGLARKIADLAQRTRGNGITPDELGGGTFTLTNTGSRGALFDTPIVNQPQVAILGTGAVVKRAVVVDDSDLGETIAIRSMAYLALSYDHRLVDGADAARFLGTVKARLEEGAFESDLGL